MEFLLGSGHVVPNESEETMRPRRNHKPAFKVKRALAAVKGDRTPAQPAEQFDVHPTRSRSPTTIELDRSAIVIIGEEQPASLSAELHVRHRYQFRQLPKILGGGCEEELIAGTIRSS